MKTSHNDHKCDYYTNPCEHIHDEMQWLHFLITAHVLRLRKVNFYEGVRDFQEFFISDGEIDALLAAGFSEEQVANDEEYSRPIAQLLAQAVKIRADIDECLVKSASNDVFLPIAQLTTCFRLSDFELQVLMICLAAQIDPRYEKLYAYLQNDRTKRYPSVDLIFNLLDLSFDERISARYYFAPRGPLFKNRILEFLENGYVNAIPLLSKYLRVNERIAGYVMGSSYIDHELSSVAEVSYEQQALDSLIVSETIKNRLKNFIKWIQDSGSDKLQNFLCVFYGPYGAGKNEAAAAVCRELGLPLLTVDMAAVVNLELPIKQTLEMAFRESLLLPAVLYFKNSDILFDDSDNSGVNSELFLKTVNENSWLSIIGSSKHLEVRGQLSAQRFIQLEFPVPDYNQRLDIWRKNLHGQCADSDETDIKELAGKFCFTGGQIRNAIATADNRVLWRSPENVRITLQDLYEGCRDQSNPKLNTLARRIKPTYTWQDIVLPKGQIAQLREITDYVKYKHVVYDDWGFNRKLSLGKGLNVLFSGPSGTGKTMAAEIIANELNMDLYKIDLSTVVSKYIGETEKNLSKIFYEAETSNAILFFDEADALFGKRSEVKDAHDRYANIEIGYLLQKIDEYTGVVILATNLRKNMDEAFVRRMHFTVEFPFPEREYRLRIWQNFFPPETPLDQAIDFQFLARNFKVAGGNIKNIALTAAFYAADGGKIVTMNHLILASKREFQKMGKLCVKADFGEYFELVKD